MLRRVSIKELCAQLDELKVRFQNSDWSNNKKNLCAEENTMRTLLGDQRNSRPMATRPASTEAPIPTDYYLSYPENNFNDYFGWNDTNDACYRLKTNDDQIPETQTAVSRALSGTSLEECGSGDFAGNVGFNVFCKNKDGSFDPKSDYATVQNQGDDVTFAGLNLPSKYGCTQGLLF